MATALSQQLRQLAVAGAQQSRRNLHGKASLLWTPQKAADIDNDTVYQVARKGFNELCALDARFKGFETTLFGPGSRDLERSQEDADVSAALDAAIDDFCVLLSGYFLLPPALPALEWLLRRYAAHERCVPALMAAALPCHASNQFVRLVQVCSLRGTLFEFLEPMQESGAALPRPGLVKRCVTDVRLLEFVLRLGRRAGAGPLAGRGVMPWYAALVCEVLAAVKTVDEALVATLLPSIVAGLGGGSKEDEHDTCDAVMASQHDTPAPTADYRAATMMMVAQLASRTTLGTDLIQALIRDVCRGTEAGGLTPSMLVLMALASRQPQLKTFPAQALADLLAVPGAATELVRLAEQHPGPGRALGRLLAPAAAALAGSDSQAVAFLDAALASPGLVDSSLARTLADSLLQVAIESSGQSARRVLRALSLRFPATMDAALAARAGTPGFASLLQAVFDGTRHAGLQGDSTLTLSMAMDAPEPGVRAAALIEMDSLITDDAASEDPERQALIDAVRAGALRRVADEEPEVTAAALLVGVLKRERPLGDDAVRAALDCLERTAGKLLGGNAYSKKQRPHARTTVKRAVTLLLPGIPVAGPSPADAGDAELAAALLGLLHATPGTLALAQSTAKRCREVAGPLTELTDALTDEKLAASLDGASPAPDASSAAESWNRMVDERLSELLLEPQKGDATLMVLQAAYAWTRGTAATTLRNADSARRGFAAHARRAVVRAVSACLAKCTKSTKHGDAVRTSPCPLASAVLQACAAEGEVLNDEQELVAAALQVADLDLGSDPASVSARRKLLVALAPRSELARQFLQRLAAAGLNAATLALDVATDTGLGAETRAAALALWARAAGECDALNAGVSEAGMTQPRRGARAKSAASSPTEFKEQATHAAAPGLVAVLACLSDSDRATRHATLETVIRPGLLVPDGEAGWWAAGTEADASAAAPLVARAIADWAAAAVRVEADADAAPGLLGRLCAGGGDAAPPATPAPKKTPRKAGSGRRSNGDTDARRALLALLSHEMHVAAENARLPIASAVLGTLTAAAATPASTEADTVAQVERVAAASFAGLFPEQARVVAAPSAALADLGCALLQAAGSEELESTTAAALRVSVPEPVRAAAIARLTPGAWMTALDDGGRRRTLIMMLSWLRREGAEETRAAADKTMHALPLEAEMAASLLDVNVLLQQGLVPGTDATQPPATVEKKRRSGQASLHSHQGDHDRAIALAGVVIPLLELLQTHPVGSSANSWALVVPVEQLLDRLAAGAAAAGTADADAEDSNGTTIPSVEGTTADYAAELALGVLSRLTGAGVKPAPRLQVVAAVLAADLGPGSAAAAASLAARLASCDVQVAVHSALELVHAIGAPDAAVLGSGQQSRVSSAAAAMLAAAAPSWASDADGLTARIVDSCTGLSPGTALALMQAVLPTTGTPRLLARLLAPDGDGEEAQPSARALAAALLESVPEAQVGSALAALLVGSLEQSNGDAAAAPARAATAFVARQVRRRRGMDANAASAVLAAALAHLQALGEHPRADARSDLDSLLEALQTVTRGGDYVRALATVLESGAAAPRSRRRAAALLAAAARNGDGDGKAGKNGAVFNADVVRRACAALGSVLASAADEPTSLVEGCLAAITALAGAVASSSAAAAPKAGAVKLGALDSTLAPPFLSLVAPVATVSSTDTRPALRASGLAALASLAAALGPRALPQLPAMLRAVLGGLERGLTPEQPDAGASLELTAGVAALDAVVDVLGPFLASHTSELLRGLLHPRLAGAPAGTPTEAARQLAARVLDRLSTTVPVRLFLPAAMSLLDDCAARGARSALGLISALGAAVPRLGAADVATHADALASFCLAALDLRARYELSGRAEDAAAAGKVEAATVGLLCALALRLSEARFRPLFLRLHDWASAAPGRQLALFAAVCGLADSLRALLVPYFSLVMNDVLAALAAVSAAQPATAPGKKRRKSEPVERVEPSMDDWRLALRATRALHRAFLYDTVEPRFLDEPRIEQVLEPLVALLHAHPPPAAATALEAEPWRMDAAAGPAPELAGGAAGTNASPRLSALEQEAGAALAQLAVSRGSEAAWKPLHAALLSATRATQPQGRMAALAALDGLATGLGEEYLALLPEALPPLAELLEDPVPEVERAAADLFRSLETLSGEDLGQYLRA